MHRTISRYVPANSEAVQDESLGAAAYLYSLSDGKPCAVAYSGQRGHPDFHLSYKSSERRAEHVARWLDGLRQAAAEKAAKRAAKKAWRHSYKVGDILSGSWGYDQTNVEFAQVVAVGEHTVTVRELAHQSVEGSDGSMSDRVMPIRDQFVGPEMVKRPQPLGCLGKDAYIVHSDSCHLYLWDGKPEYRSWYA